MRRELKENERRALLETTMIIGGSSADRSMSPFTNNSFVRRNTSPFSEMPHMPIIANEGAADQSVQ
jgi:hypothetical protein